ncbi:MAG: hypothetical protein ABF780_05310 [Bifidobacterium aquikefiri]|uniref:Flp pilus assembly protein n=1 Tax=Bifidobacterium aquikefiri TaxID=1653207 RepID=A0A261G3W2_9BIFI|nr:hypothetical protein [Bifidobacterium aquikefiri]OZG66088.1 Flp pilus assembly protein [Bifidobacterium aquikefiri]
MQIIEVWNRVDDVAYGFVCVVLLMCSIWLVSRSLRQLGWNARLRMLDEFSSNSAHNAALLAPRDSGGRSIGRLRSSGAYRMGIPALIASLSSLLRNGSDVVTAFEEVAGREFATKELNLQRAMNLVEAAHGGHGNSAEIVRVAHHLLAAYRLSAQSGCEMVKCLDAVGASLSRAQRIEELRTQACSMPLATIRLLSWLPLVSIALGELIGAKTMRFLFTTIPGAACLAIGLALYACGLVWTRSLKKGLSK